MKSKEFKAVALDLISKGFNVIPICSWKDPNFAETQRGKRPLIAWSEFINRKTNEEDIEKWSKKYKEANLGIIAGKEWNLTIIDADNSDAVRFLEDELKIPKTLKVKTGKGIHYYFKYCNSAKVKTNSNVIPSKVQGIDIRSDSGYVISPYSTHRSGAVYQWIDDSVEIADFPESLQLLIEQESSFSEAKSGYNGYDITKDLIEGQRNKILASIVGTLNHKGIPKDLIASLVHELNRRAVNPEDDETVDMVIQSASRYENAPPMEEWTDYGLGTMFLRDHGDILRFSQESGDWYSYDGKRWSTNYTQRGTYLNQDLVDIFSAFREIYSTKIENNPDIDAEVKKNFQKFLRSYGDTNRMSSFFKGLAVRNAISDSVFDTNPYLFNCGNVTLDLRSGEPTERSKDNMLSKISEVKYNAGAQCPRWLEFLNTIFAGNQEIIRFIQVALGYTMIGKVKEKALFVMVGEGDNGKSVFMDVLSYIFGKQGDRDDFTAANNYCSFANFSSFTTVRDGQIRCDLVDLKGARFVYASEGKAEAILDDTLIKAITGADEIRARRLYQNEVVFKPTFKIWLATNNEPRTLSVDKAMRVRVKMINFNVIIPKEQQDFNLREKLVAESSGILNWILEGVKIYNAEGLVDSETVVRDSKEYMDNNDYYKQFADEMLEQCDGVAVEARGLFNSYCTWYMGRTRSNKPPSETHFGSKFYKHMNNAHGWSIKKDEKSRVRRYLNLKFKD